MCAQRNELQEALCQYATDTLAYIDTVREFSKKSSKWILTRETELEMLMDIKDRADKIDLKFSHIFESENKGEAALEYMKSVFSQATAERRRAELEEELAASLKGILGGLEELDGFLDAVEKLAVTSSHVFPEDEQVLVLPEGISPEFVQVVISVAQNICPLLLEFKRDAPAFFSPKLQNVHVMAYQLDKYIQTTQKICEKFEKRPFSDFCLKKTAVELDEDLSEDEVQKMLSHIDMLNEFRMDQDFRMIFLFQGKSCSGFISAFSERKLKMLQFLNDLEECAVQLDRMNKGAKISSVAGSSVGAVGGVLSIIGLALIPVTAGVSLGLTVAGMTLGVTSGVNSVVTTATEMGVNHTHQKKASEVFQSFMDDVQMLQSTLAEVSHQREINEADVVVGVGKMLGKAGTVAKGIDALVDAGAAVKMLRSEEMVASVGNVVAQEGKALRNVPRVASDIPDVGQAAAKGPLALSKSARGGLIALNALFLGMDVFFICKDSISLAKGSKTKVSQFIRARAALWKSEIDSWQKIHDSLEKGELTSDKKKAVLETPFYPENETKSCRKTETETETEASLDQVDEKLQEKQQCVIQ
ncbi:uncharacterized protein apol [Sphaeramia orbicularis]|uniref:Uncharacterized LOC115424962 n=1 Tax=Sphaeramia orbicularis TaxID=375764 RepID=A0A672YUV0_9TELE|nr:uncharacterized protein LOC115424962 [Sphaeramia orbicularis]